MVRAREPPKVLTVQTNGFSKRGACLDHWAVPAGGWAARILLNLDLLPRRQQTRRINRLWQHGGGGGRSGPGPGGVMGGRGWLSSRPGKMGVAGWVRMSFKDRIQALLVFYSEIRSNANEDNAVVCKVTVSSFIHFAVSFPFSVSSAKKIKVPFRVPYWFISKQKLQRPCCSFCVSAALLSPTRTS